MTNNSYVFSKILDITRIPGSSDDVALTAIKYYKNLLNEPNLSNEDKSIIHALISNLTTYYEMSNLDSPKLRHALPHLSESANFMESKSSTDINIESTGRIKSFKSFYQKLIDKICNSSNKNFQSNEFLFDIYATRDIFYPRYDMKFNPETFYKHTYKTIFEYMEYIDNLSKTDSRYGFLKYSEQTSRDIERPKIYTYNPFDINIPTKDFIDYILEIKNIPEEYRYLADLANNYNLSASSIKNSILKLKSPDVTSIDIPKLDIYNGIDAQTKKENQCKLRNYLESLFLNRLSEIKKDSITEDYSKISSDDFIKKYNSILTPYDIDCYNFINYLTSYINSNEILDSSNMPKFQSKVFPLYLKTNLSEYVIQPKTGVGKKLEIFQNLNLDNFENNLEEACKIERYSHCIKDYMKNPKANGYQSFHIIVLTPFGPYEKQFRTSKQNKYAEHGLASHSKFYKPNEKDEFHRLSIPKFFSPKRNSNNDIIHPIELGILPFEHCVHSFYAVPFATFANGRSFEQFKSQFDTKEELDQALLALSPVPTENHFIAKIMKTFSQKGTNTSNINLSIETNSRADYIPSDISVYSEKDDTFYPPAVILPKFNFANTKNKPASTDDSDPHDTR